MKTKIYHSHCESHHINTENETKTLIVIILTVVTMVAEITYGYLTNSMSLLADGYHMGTHALALGLTYIAYILTRKYEHSELFPQGTEKIGILTAYTSSLFLGLTGLWIIYEAISRFFNPLKINFNDAILVAIIGLVVNAVCILIMEKHEHSCKHEKKDYNFLAAYYHIMADAMTSVLAIVALLIGKCCGVVCFDPIIGILGGFLILRWATKLLKDTVIILLDMKK